MENYNINIDNPSVELDILVIIRRQN